MKLKQAKQKSKPAPANRPAPAKRPRFADNPAIVDLQTWRGLPFSPEGSATATVGGKVRLKKDILKVGKWLVRRGGKPQWWTVDAVKLSQVFNDFKAAQASGFSSNLIWGHGDDESGIVDPRDIIAQVDDVQLIGDTIYAYFWVSTDLAEKLKNPAFKTSPRVAEPWYIGSGKRFDALLLHVGVVDLPVITGQGNFVELSQVLSLAASSMKGKTAMSWDKVQEVLNKLLGYFGMTLPEAITEENFDSLIDVIMSVWESQNGAEEPAETADPAASMGGGGAGAATIADPATGSPVLSAASQTAGKGKAASMQTQQAPAGSAIESQLASLAQTVNTLAQTVNTLSQAGVQSKKKDFESQVTSLAMGGHLDGKTAKALLAKGAALDYDLEILKGFSAVKMTDLSHATAPFVNGTPQQVGTPDQSKWTKERLEAAAQQLGARMKKAAAS